MYVVVIVDVVPRVFLFFKSTRVLSAFLAAVDKWKGCDSDLAAGYLSTEGTRKKAKPLFGTTGSWLPNNIPRLYIAGR